MTSVTDNPELETAVRFWGHAYTFEYDPDTRPREPYGARRKDGKRTLRAATPALLLDAVKDDQRHPGTPS